MKDGLRFLRNAARSRCLQRVRTAQAALHMLVLKGVNTSDPAVIIESGVLC